MTEAKHTEAEQTTEIGSWFRRRRVLLALFRNDDYRRDVYTLVWMNLRRVIDWRLVVVAVALAAGGAWAFLRFGDSPRTGYDILQGAFAVAALAAGAVLYSTERDKGTFELLWLATGSEKSLLRMKLGTYLLVLVALIVVPAFLAANFYEEFPSPVGVIFYLAISGIFILSMMAYIGTYLPQAWAAGLCGFAILGACYFMWHDAPFTFDPLLNPIPPEFTQRRQPPSMMTNRIFMLILSGILLKMAATRLRKTF